VSQFQELPESVLVAISRASGDTYGPIDGRRLIAELHDMGHDPDSMALANLLFELRDAELVKCQGVGNGGAEAFGMISLAPRGRERVEGWPGASGVSTGDIEALLKLLDARAEDPDLPEGERRKWRAAGKALRDIGVGTVGSAFTAWLRSLGWIP
jgi:hypothetical protein